MGQQQLLLIVLGVIIVGIAIFMGIVLYRAHAINTKKEALVNDCLNISVIAQKFYKTPKEMGGGSNSFDGSTGGIVWVIPTELTNTANGRYVITEMNKDDLLITATGNEIVVNNDSVKVHMRVHSNSTVLEP